MNPADAARRRELQRRLYSPGGALTAEEAEELRALSTDGAADAPTVASAPDRSSVEASSTVAADEAPAAAAAEPQEATAAEPSMGGTGRRRWLISAVAGLAVALGFGIGWLTSSQPSHSVPKMTSPQARAQDAIEATGEVDPGTLAFAGAKHGAAVWTASRGADKCLAVTLEKQRSIVCADPEEGTYGSGAISTGLQVEHGDTQTAVSVNLVMSVTGEWSVLVDHWQTDLNDTDWEQQYAAADLRLAHALQDDGFDPRNLQLLGRDGDLPIWAYLSDRQCAVIVAPGTLEIMQSCVPAGSEEAAEVHHQQATYRVTWSDLHGARLTVIRDAG